MSWEGVTDMHWLWSDLWKITQARLSFQIRSTYDTLPCPRNLQQWFSTEERCPFCSTSNASLQHILSGCKTALSQGRYRWRHNLVSRKLAEGACTYEANSSHPYQREVPFCLQGPEKKNYPCHHSTTRRCIGVKGAKHP